MVDMSKTICRNPECGHPRAEHRSRFVPQMTDYEYQECSVFECPCQAYVGGTVSEASAGHEETSVETLQSCSACGSDMLGHTYLGAGCLAICESNWKKLRVLERAASDVKVIAAISNQQTAQESLGKWVAAREADRR